MTFEQLATEYVVWEPGTDKAPFQKRARLLQSLWRENQGYAIGTKDNSTELLGSMLAMPWAEETLANYLTPSIQQVVREEVLDPILSKGKLYDKPRLFGNLLSSQPLCFNLFGEIARDLSLASKAFRELTNGYLYEVTDFRFEHSPGRRNPKYLNDRTSFDVFVNGTSQSGETVFLGIEVKYHEHLKDEEAMHKERYEEVARGMNCFKSEAYQVLRKRPLEQIWRDHLLAGSMLLNGDFDTGIFVFLYPKDNTYCSDAVDSYISCLSDTSTFQAWTMEDVFDVLSKLAPENWSDEFFDRYLAFSKIDKLLESFE
jgi:hypothetical protein